MNMIIDASWLASHLDDENLIIIDARGIMPFRFSHIKNAVPMGVEKVISTDENGGSSGNYAPSCRRNIY